MHPAFQVLGIGDAVNPSPKCDRRRCGLRAVSVPITCRINGLSLVELKDMIMAGTDGVSAWQEKNLYLPILIEPAVKQAESMCMFGIRIAKWVAYKGASGACNVLSRVFCGPENLLSAETSRSVFLTSVTSYDVPEKKLAKIAAQNVLLRNAYQKERRDLSLDKVSPDLSLKIAKGVEKKAFEDAKKAVVTQNGVLYQTGGWFSDTRLAKRTVFDGVAFVFEPVSELAGFVADAAGLSNFAQSVVSGRRKCLYSWEERRAMRDVAVATKARDNARYIYEAQCRQGKKAGSIAYKQRQDQGEDRLKFGAQAIARGELIAAGGPVEWLEGIQKVCEAHRAALMDLITKRDDAAMEAIASQEAGNRKYHKVCKDVSEIVNALDLITRELSWFYPAYREKKNYKDSGQFDAEDFRVYGDLLPILRLVQGCKNTAIRLLPKYTSDMLSARDLQPEAEILVRLHQEDFPLYLKEMQSIVDEKVNKYLNDEKIGACRELLVELEKLGGIISPDEQSNHQELVDLEDFMRLVLSSQMALDVIPEILYAPKKEVTALLALVKYRISLRQAVHQLYNDNAQYEEMLSAAVKEPSVEKRRVALDQLQAHITGMVKRGFELSEIRKAWEAADGQKGTDASQDGTYAEDLLVDIHRGIFDRGLYELSRNAINELHRLEHAEQYGVKEICEIVQYLNEAVRCYQLILDGSNLDGLAPSAAEKEQHDTSVNELDLGEADASDGERSAGSKLLNATHGDLVATFDRVLKRIGTDRSIGIFDKLRQEITQRQAGVSQEVLNDACEVMNSGILALMKARTPRMALLNQLNKDVFSLRDAMASAPAPAAFEGEALGTKPKVEISKVSEANQNEVGAGQLLKQALAMVKSLPKTGHVAEDGPEPVDVSSEANLGGGAAAHEGDAVSVAFAAKGIQPSPRLGISARFAAALSSRMSTASRSSILVEPFRARGRSFGLGPNASPEAKEMESKVDAE